MRRNVNMVPSVLFEISSTGLPNESGRWHATQDDILKSVVEGVRVGLLTVQQTVFHKHQHRCVYIKIMFYHGLFVVMPYDEHMS